jgi:hypothetical protein
MVRSKLTDDDQRKLAQLYRDSDATTASLAEQFKVSVSTVTRILRDNIPAHEYQKLIAAKRAATRTKEISLGHLSLDLDLEDMPLDPIQEGVDDLEDMPLDPIQEDVDDLEDMPLDPILPLVEDSFEEDVELDEEPEPLSQGIRLTLDSEDREDPEEREDPVQHSGLEVEMLEDLQLDLRGQPPEEDLELDDEDEDEDEDDSEEVEFGEDILSPEELHVQVLPLEELDPPPICYVVIDRHQELTTCPLKDFISSPESLREAGISPEVANQARTLPVFYNHRVARRFSEMSRRGGNPPHKIIRFSGHLLEIVRHQLQNKGITHLLVDGQIYSLQSRIREEL